MQNEDEFHNLFPVFLETELERGVLNEGNTVSEKTLTSRELSSHTLSLRDVMADDDAMSDNIISGAVADEEDDVAKSKVCIVGHLLVRSLRTQSISM